MAIKIAIKLLGQSLFQLKTKFSLSPIPANNRPAIIAGRGIYINKKRIEFFKNKKRKLILKTQIKKLKTINRCFLKRTIPKAPITISIDII